MLYFCVMKYIDGDENYMNYGTLHIAQEYDKKGKIDEWVQLFLHSDGKNVALADGLIRDKREYLGIVKLKISLFNGIEQGAPEYLTTENEQEYFFWVVERMKDSLEQWDVPPLIVEFRNNHFYVNDGRHRLEMFRQLGVDQIDAVLWTTGEEDKNKVLELIR